MRAKKFINISEKDFVGCFDGKEYKIKAKDCLFTFDYIAEHLAKHFVDRELNEQNKKTDDKKERGLWLGRCLTGVLVEAEDEKSLFDKIKEYEDYSKC